MTRHFVVNLHRWEKWGSSVVVTAKNPTEARRLALKQATGFEGVPSGWDPSEDRPIQIDSVEEYTPRG